MKKILIVDDEKMIVEVLSDFLEENGYTVLIARDGMQAVMQANRNKPDLILLDIMLPAGSGFTVLDRLRQSVLTQNIPIIMLTATAPIDAVRQKLPPGDKTLVFSKPWNSKELISAIDGILNKSDNPPPAQ